VLVPVIPVVPVVVVRPPPVGPPLCAQWGVRLRCMLCWQRHHLRIWVSHCSQLSVLLLSASCMASPGNAFLGQMCTIVIYQRVRDCKIFPVWKCCNFYTLCGALSMIMYGPSNLGAVVWSSVSSSTPLTLYNF